MKKKVSVNMEVSISSLSLALQELEQEVLIDVIKQLDLAIAEVDFTEQLILMLTKSFKNDLTVEEKDRLMVAIRDSMR